MLTEDRKCPDCGCPKDRCDSYSEGMRKCCPDCKHPLVLGDPGDPKVIEAMTRKCTVCQVKPGHQCVCVVHKGAHFLTTCPTATPRFVHHSRVLPPPRGGQ